MFTIGKLESIEKYEVLLAALSVGLPSYVGYPLAVGMSTHLQIQWLTQGRAQESVFYESSRG